MGMENPSGGNFGNTRIYRWVEEELQSQIPKKKESESKKTGGWGWGETFRNEGNKAWGGIGVWGVQNLEVFRETVGLMKGRARIVTSPKFSRESLKLTDFSVLAAKSNKKGKFNSLQAKQNVSVAGSPGCQFATSEMKGFEKGAIGEHCQKGWGSEVWEERDWQ